MGLDRRLAEVETPRRSRRWTCHGRSAASPPARARSAQHEARVRKAAGSVGGRRATSSISSRVTRGREQGVATAITRIASINCSAGGSLSRNPLAPARDRGVDVVVEVERREDQHPAGPAPGAGTWVIPRRRPRSRPSAASGRPSERHPGVTDSTISTPLQAVGGLADHGDVGLRLRGSSGNPGPHHRLVVDDQDGGGHGPTRVGASLTVRR